MMRSPSLYCVAVNSWKQRGDDDDDGIIIIIIFQVTEAMAVP
jgi:hypothetical protein